MGGKDRIEMSQRDLQRWHVVKKAIGKEIRQKQAGEILGISQRQVRRLVKRVRETGEAGIIHGNRGKASNHCLEPALKEKVLKLYEKKYGDFGPTLGSEKLWEMEGIGVLAETLRLWLIEKQIEYRGRRRRKHRNWRPRKASFGEMVQMDGSHHEWLEGRGPRLVLMGYKDDATGEVYGRFYEYEGTMPAMDSFRRYTRRYGIPQSVYLDKHVTYKGWKKRLSLEEELDGSRKPKSQFERALGELGVKVIHANSPEAKGRIERQFKTFQHRLVREFRMAGAKTLEQANEILNRYLPGYNKRFNVAAANPADLHRPISKGLHLDRIFCLKEKRFLRKDCTVCYGGKLYQILNRLRAQEITVEEKLDGSIRFSHNGNYLDSRLTAPVPKQTPKSKLPTWISMRRIPAKEHPWKVHRAPLMTLT